jgi:hypothetical protein
MPTKSLEGTGLRDIQIWECFPKFDGIKTFRKLEL